MFETHFVEKKLILNHLVSRFQMLNVFYSCFSYQASMLTSIEVSRGSPSAPELSSFFFSRPGTIEISPRTQFVVVFGKDVNICFGFLVSRIYIVPV